MDAIFPIRPDTDTAPPSTFSVEREGRFDRRKLPVMVADYIAGMILEADLQPGQKLESEQDMLRSLQVARGTLREALRLLEAEGLITIKTGPGGGPVVDRPDLGRLTRNLLIFLLTSGATLRHVHEARRVLYPLISRLAAENATAEQKHALLQSVTSMQEKVEDEEAFLAENSRFLRLMAEASGNPVLMAFSVSMLDILDGYSIGVRYTLRSRRETIKSYVATVAAISDCDARMASELTDAHVAEALNYIVHKYPERLDERLRPGPVYRRASALPVAPAR